MPTITIPHRVKKEDELVAIPRKEYEQLLRAWKSGIPSVAVKRTMKVSAKHKEFYDHLDRELTDSLRDIDFGKTNGPFNTAEEAIRFLRRQR